MLHELISKRCFYDQGVKWVLVVIAAEMRAVLIRAVRNLLLAAAAARTLTCSSGSSRLIPFPPQNVIMKFSLLCAQLMGDGHYELR